MSIRLAMVVAALMGWWGTAVASPAEEAVRAHAAGDYAAAWAKAVPPALEGDAAAQHLIGVMLFDGQGTGQDKCLATLWFDKAARRGHVDAQYRLGMAYAWGYGVSREDHRAFNWLAGAKRGGHKEAGRALAQILDRTPPDRRRSEVEALATLRHAYAAELDYTPTPAQLLDNPRSIARNWLSPCAGPEPLAPPPRRDYLMEGLPSLEPGLAYLEQGNYLAAFDDLLAGAMYARDQAIDTMAMLAETGRIALDRCMAALWAQHGKRIPRPTAYLAEAYASGRAFKQDHEKAYLWAYWLHTREPSLIDLRPFEAKLDQDTAARIRAELDILVRQSRFDVTFIIPADIRAANPGLMPGLAPCGGGEP